MLGEHLNDSGTISFNYAEGPPSGTPMVMLHGGGGQWISFMTVIPELVDRWHIFAPDLRGHGKSGRAPGAYRFEDYAGDTVSMLRGVCVMGAGHNVHRTQPLAAMRAVTDFLESQ